LVTKFFAGVAQQLLMLAAAVLFVRSGNV